jgi:hypothetical protein
MLTRSDNRVNPGARTNGIEIIAATRIRRPCNSNPRRVRSLLVTLAAAIAMLAVFADRTHAQKERKLDERINGNAQQMVDEGRQIFRFDTFGDEAFWGDTLKLHQAIQGLKSGGVGPGVSPKTALAVGLKVDADALPNKLLKQLKKGEVDLDDPATTVALLKLNAVVGLTGFLNSGGTLRSIGIQWVLF